MNHTFSINDKVAIIDRRDGTVIDTGTISSLEEVTFDGETKTMASFKEERIKYGCSIKCLRKIDDCG